MRRRPARAPPARARPRPRPARAGRGRYTGEHGALLLLPKLARGAPAAEAWVDAARLGALARRWLQAAHRLKQARVWSLSSEAVRAALVERSQRSASLTRQAREQRATLWHDALRELSVSSDRLYIFLRTLAGTLHESIEAVIEVSDSSIQADVERERRSREELMRRSAEFSNQVVSGVFEAALKSAKFDFGLRGEEVVVSSKDTVDAVRKLAEGESGMSYFEAANSLQAALQGQETYSLTALIDSLSVVLRRMRDSQLDALDGATADPMRAAVSYLSAPRNSFTVRLKAEAAAAIKTAWVTFCVEFDRTQRGRRPSAHDVIEGPDHVLRTTFATYAAYTLAHSRIFSSSASVYVSRSATVQNLSMMRVTLVKLTRRAAERGRRP